MLSIRRVIHAKKPSRLGVSKGLRVVQYICDHAEERVG